MERNGVSYLRMVLVRDWQTSPFVQHHSHQSIPRKLMDAVPENGRRPETHATQPPMNSVRVSSRRHTAQPRCCRWLPYAHDLSPLVTAERGSGEPLSHAHRCLQRHRRYRPRLIPCTP